MQKWGSDITMDYDSLKESVAILKKIMPSKPMLPVLEFILMEFDTGTVKVSSTNLESYITIAFECEDANPMLHHSVCLNVKDLSMALKAIGKSKDIKLTPVYSTTIEDALLGMQVNKFITVDVLDPDEFPPSLKLDRAFVEYNTHDLASRILAVAPMTSSDPARPVLQQINLWVDETSRIALSAADGFRLVLWGWKFKEERRKIDSPDIMILGNHAAKMAEIMLGGQNTWGKMHVETNETTKQASRTKFSWYHVGKKLFAHIIMGFYSDALGDIPNYEQVIPADNSKFYGFSVNKDVFKQALETLAVLYEKKKDANWMLYGFVKPSNHLSLAVRYEDKTVRLKVPLLDWTLHDDPEQGQVPFVWTANIGFLIDALAPFGDVITFKTTASGAGHQLSPYIITGWSPRDCKVILMGMVSDASTSTYALGDGELTADEYKLNTEIYQRLVKEDQERAREMKITFYLSGVEAQGENLRGYSLVLDHPDTELAEDIVKRWKSEHYYSQFEVQIEHGILQERLTWR